MIQVITSEVKEVKPFPKLMKSNDGTIVLFHKEEYGFVILPTESILVTPVGWDMKKFTDYNEPLTIQNV